MHLMNHAREADNLERADEFLYEVCNVVDTMYSINTKVTNIGADAVSVLMIYKKHHIESIITYENIRQLGKNAIVMALRNQVQDIIDYAMMEENTNDG